MNYKILLLVIIIFSQAGFGQITFDENIIVSDNTSILDWPRFVFADDIDGDGDIDVLSTSIGDDKIAWYENTDGLGDFGPQQIITNNVDAPQSIYTVDIDNDGDKDIISASSLDNKIAWYENIDGLGNFGPQQVITNNFDSAQAIYAEDLNGNGTIDVLSASAFSIYNDGKIVWYENINGLGTFGSQQVIPNNSDSFTSRSLFAIDIDNDGDIDVICASFNSIDWYENTDGQGNFGSQQIITSNVSNAQSVYASDIDGDGDIDVLSASYNDDKIAWYENTDGLGNFGSQQVITTNADSARFVYASDIDGDGDNDVLSVSTSDGIVGWYENIDGEGTFGPRQVIINNPDLAPSIYVADIDGDGSMDIISASALNDKLAWYKNQSNLSISENKKSFFSLFPNPASNQITLKGHIPIDNISLLDINGRILKTHKGFSNFELKINLENLSKGIYFLQITSVNQKEVTKFIKN